MHTEDVYVRSGFRHIQIQGERLQDTLYTRNNARHQDVTRCQHLKLLGRGNASRFMILAIQNLKKSQKNVPECGYSLMPLNLIQARYDYQNTR